jgi:hypothetical protein
MKIRQGCEPGTFTGFFGVWDPESWTVNWLNNHFLIVKH